MRKLIKGQLHRVTSKQTHHRRHMIESVKHAKTTETELNKNHTHTHKQQALTFSGRIIDHQSVCNGVKEWSTTRFVGTNDP